MKLLATDWNEVALTKLRNVMGPSAGPALARSVLAELGLERLTSGRELKVFAEALAKRGGFASAVGALLLLHATMYESTPPPALTG